MHYVELEKQKKGKENEFFTLFPAFEIPLTFNYHSFFLSHEHHLGFYFQV